jgi:hypothetical protein
MVTIITREQLAQTTGSLTSIILAEHLGDIIACEPVVRYARRTWTETSVLWVVKEQYFEALIGHPDLDYLLPVENLLQAFELSERLSERGRVINLHLSGRLCPDTLKLLENDNDPTISYENYFKIGSLLEVFSLAARLPGLTEAPRFHVLPFVHPPPLPQDYVVLHCRSNEVKKDWMEAKWTMLADRLIAEGLAVAEIGFAPMVRPDRLRYGYHDLTDIHHIQVIAAIIRDAHFFIGIDSSFAHLANALSTNGLVIMGRLDNFINYMPYTGFYAEPGHVVRGDPKPACTVSVNAVMAAFHGRKASVRQQYTCK